MSRYKSFPLISGAIFLLTAFIAVASAWIRGVHLYDMGISFSSYVGLNRPISVLWFISAVIIIILMTIYTVKTPMPLVKKIIYGIIFLCIFGTAFFPFNTFSEHPTAITIDLHNSFAIALMLMTTISFILTVILSKNKIQKIIAVCSIGYAFAFIALYFCGFLPLFNTFFIWENLFIILLLIALQMER